MMYCRQCGRELSEDSSFCPGCGTRQDAGADRGAGGIGAGDRDAGYRQDYYASTAYRNRPGIEHDAPSMGFAVLCFFFPVVGLILYLVWRETLPLRARSAGKGAIIGVSLYVVMIIIVFGLILSLAAFRF